MSLSRNNGTNDVLQGKFFRNNGTNDVQIGKIFRGNGTVDSLIYSAECQLFPVSETEDTYTSWKGGGVSSTASYINIPLSRSETKYNYCDKQVDLTGYDYINFTVDTVSGTDGFWCNIGVSETITTAPQRAVAIESGKAGTYSVKIDDLNGLWYMLLRGKRGEHDGTAFHITNIWLS